MASILLAFAIDAAWEARVERTQERAVLAAIRGDMISNVEELERVIGVGEEAFEALSVFLEGTPSSLQDLPPDSAGVIVFYLPAAATFTPYQGSLTSANLALLSDIELRTQLGTWLGQAADVEEDGPFLIQGTQRIEELSSAAGALRSRAAAAGRIAEAPSASVVIRRLREDVGFVDAVLQFDRFRRIDYRKLRLLQETTELIQTRLPE